MTIYNLGVIHLRLVLEGIGILTTVWFLWHNFGSSYPRKPINGFEDSDDSLVSKKNLSHKIGSLDWCLGPGKVSHKNAKAPPLVTFPHENPKPKTEIFFQSKLEDLLNQYSIGSQPFLTMEPLS